MWANLLKSEKLKFKFSHTMITVFSLPLLCIFFALIFGGPYLFVQQSIFWWQGVFSMLMVELVAVINISLEKKAYRGFNIKTGELDEKLFLRVKSVWYLYYSFLGMLIQIVIFLIFRILLSSVDNIQSIYRMFIFGFSCWLSSIWVIPLHLIVANYINGTVLLIINAAISLIVAPFVAMTGMWELFPYTYGYKTGEYIYNIKPNGVAINGYMDISRVIIVLLASVIFFLLFSVILGYYADRNTSMKLWG